LRVLLEWPELADSDRVAPFVLSVPRL